MIPLGFIAVGCFLIFLTIPVFNLFKSDLDWESCFLFGALLCCVGFCLGFAEGETPPQPALEVIESNQKEIILKITLPVAEIEEDK